MPKRCPVCGEQNPDSLAICLVCQAYMDVEPDDRESVVPDQPAEEIAQDGGGLPDWFRQWAGESPEELTAQPAVQQENLTTASQEPGVEPLQAVQSVTGEESQATLPDWFQEMATEQAEPAAEAPHENTPLETDGSVELALQSGTEVVDPQPEQELTFLQPVQEQADLQPELDQVDLQSQQIASDMQTEQEKEQIEPVSEQAGSFLEPTPEADQLGMDEQPQEDEPIQPVVDLDADLQPGQEVTDQPSVTETDEFVTDEPLEPGTVQAEVEEPPAESIPVLEALPLPAAYATVDAPPAEHTPDTAQVRPLEGLKGTIPISIVLEPVKKPGALPTQVSATEIHRVYSELMSERFFTEEDSIDQFFSRFTPRAQSPLRTIIAVILLAAVLVPLVLKGNWGQLSSIPAEIEIFQQAVEALPESAPVLLAVDFEPASSVEMEAASVAVVDHLMKRNASLYLVSTLPSGPVQAERLLEKAGRLRWQTDPEIAPYLDYVNIGLIPGGPAGLASFFADASKFLPGALPASFVENLAADQVETGSVPAPVWSMIVVITEDTDVSRYWIEQTGEYLTGQPLLFVTSAQIEPLIQTYFSGEISQVDGLVVSVAGGAIYETLSGRRGPAIEIWSAFALGIWAAAAIMLLLILINLGRAWIKRTPPSTGEEWV